MIETEKAFFCTENAKYENVKLLKNGERSSVFVVRKKENGKRFLLRITDEKAEVYKKLLGISSENLPEIVEVFEEKEKSIIVEEYVSGDTLFDLLRNGILSEKEAVECAVQICNALSVLHEHGIVHRDVKPENVMINSERTVLIDFDASRKTDPQKSNDTKILGTTGYASPEQYGLSQTDARSDIYSLGVVLIVMLTGEHPSTRLANGKLGEIVQKCTMINPDMRFQSANELKKALEESLKVPGKIKAGMLTGIMMTLVFVLMLNGDFVSTEGNAPEHESNEQHNIAEEILSEEKTVLEKTDNLMIKSEIPAEGKSNILPDDFYDYWDKEEIITEGVEIFLPGNLGDYISYEFSDDVWTFTIGNIPAEEWKKAFEECSENGTDISAKIETSAPNKNVIEFTSRRGNGPTYNMLKNQHANENNLLFNGFNPETEKEITYFEFVKIIGDENGFWAIPFQRDSIFYTVFLWLEADGTETWRIFPFQFVLGEDCEAAFFESDVTLPEVPEISEENIWIDELWEPITDPDRIVFKTVFEEMIYREKSFLKENGLDVKIFEKPGYVNVKANSEANPNKIDAMEFFVLPPDASERRPDENLNNWLKRVYEETEFAGYKLSDLTLDVYSDPHNPEVEMLGVESGRFYNITDRRTISILLLQMYSAKSGEKTVWGMQKRGDYSALVINWYKENPNENPNAKPEVFEYVYSHYEDAVIVR